MVLRHPARALVLLGSVVAAAAVAHAEEPELSAWREATETGALQARVEALLPGDTLRLEAGRHEGPIVIEVPGVTLEGGGRATIDGRGLGTVVSVRANGVTLEGLTLEGSGDSNPLVHAGLSIEDRVDVTVRGCRIRDALFGIDIANSERVEVTGCDIASKDLHETFRGDAFRIWHSKDIRIIDNHWHDARDAVAWYSKRVRFEGNVARRSRYSVHSMYSEDLEIVDNTFEKNSVGVFLMYGQRSTVVGNTIREAVGATGIGLGLKETSSVYVRNNRFVYCATGILVDNSPWEPNTFNWFHENLLAFNGAGVVLANDRAGNEFRENHFRSNRSDVDTEARQTSPSRWVANYWAQYEGFDRDRDGVGDTPHVPKKYGDLVTGAHPAAEFFTGSPVLTLTSLLERMVPITDPITILRDEEPRLTSHLTGARP